MDAKLLERAIKYIWIILAIFCFVLSVILPADIIEQYYSTGLFIYIRLFFDTIVSKLPFPAYYLFITCLLIVIFNWIRHFVIKDKVSIQEQLKRVFSFAGFLSVCFYVLWGFNYGRISFENRNGLSIESLIEQQSINEFNKTLNKLVVIRKQLYNDTGRIPEDLFTNNIENKSRQFLNYTLRKFNYPYSTKIRGRIVTADMFLLFGIGGQYLPFVGEGNIDNAVYYSKKPFYLIHELAHGNGFTEEATCNLLAYISCVQSKNLAFQYSGELNYLFYLLSDIKKQNRKVCIDLEMSMPDVVKKDILDIRKHYSSHSFKSSKIGDRINDFYLKRMGVKDGTDNYNKMILLVYAWNQKQTNQN